MRKSITNLGAALLLCFCGSTQTKVPDSQKWPVVLDNLKLSVSLKEAVSYRIEQRFNKKQETFELAMKQGLLESQKIILLEREKLDELITEEELAQKGVTIESGFSGFNSAKAKLFCQIDVSRARPRVLQIEAICQIIGIQSSKVLSLYSKGIEVKAAQSKDNRTENTNRVKKLIQHVSFLTAEKLPNLISAPEQ